MLNDDVLFQIFLYLEAKSIILNLKMVCKQFYGICTHFSFWKEYLGNTFPSTLIDGIETDAERLQYYAFSLENYETLGPCKVIMLGESAVGKTSIVQRFVRGYGYYRLFVHFFDVDCFEAIEPVIGAAFLKQTVEVNSKIIEFDIWDTAGQERYKSLAPMYYRNSFAVIVVFDVTNRNSFDRAVAWTKEVRRQSKYPYGDNRKDWDEIICGITEYDESFPLVLLVGNKIDLTARRNVSENEAEEVVKKHNLGFYIETSAKTMHNITALFVKIGELLLEKHSRRVILSRMIEKKRIEEQNKKLDLEQPFSFKVKRGKSKSRGGNNHVCSIL